jgi:hypothetical protein
LHYCLFDLFHHRGLGVLLDISKRWTGTERAATLFVSSFEVFRLLLGFGDGNTGNIGAMILLVAAGIGSTLDGLRFLALGDGLLVVMKRRSSFSVGSGSLLG